jgi:acyl-CoA thioester hydrolase
VTSVSDDSRGGARRATFRDPPRFAWPVRVYWEDTDGGGVVYHSQYLAFMERARSEWLRALGADQSAIRDGERVQFAVVEMNVRWRRAARYDDALTVTVELAGTGGATLGFRQAVLRGEEVLVEADVRVAAVDADGLRPRRLPRAIVELL